MTYEIYVTFELHLEMLTKTNNLRIQKARVTPKFALLTRSTKSAIHNFEFAYLNMELKNMHTEYAKSSVQYLKNN